MVCVPSYTAFTPYRFTLYVVFIVLFIEHYVSNRKECTVLYNGKIKFISNIM